MKNKELVSAIGLAATVALLLGGCAATPAQSTDPGRGKSTDLSGRIRIGLAAPAAALLLPLVAQDEGIFKKHGLNDVEVTFMPGPQLIPAAAGGAFEIAISAPPAAQLTALQGGGSLQTLAGWVKNPGQVLVVTENIKTVKDLRGRKVGINGSKGQSSSLLMNQALRQNGMTFDDVQVLVTQDAVTQVQSFVGGQIDAMVTGEPLLSRAIASRPGSHVIEDYSGLDYFPGTEVNANKKWLDSKPDQAVAVLQALDEALQLWKSAPEVAKKSIGKNLKLDSTDPQIDMLYTHTIDKLFTKSLQPVSVSDTQKLLAMLRDNGFPEAKDDMAGTIVRTDVLEKALGKKP